MENLNAENVKKALEQFSHRILKTNLAEKVTESEIMAIINALALITSQEQRIKELTEENERLRADCAKGANALIEEMQKNRTIEADTVKKLREKVNKFFDAVFDQIAKEMLEGE